MFAALIFLSFGLSHLALAEVITIPVTPVTDQGDTLQCWAVSSVARMDVDASRRAGELLKLSARYVVYAKTRDEVVDLILQGRFREYSGSLCETCRKENIFYEQGGIFADAVEAVRDFGILPEEVYGGFPGEDESLFRALNHLIRQYAFPKHPIHFNDPALRRKVVREVTEIMNRYWGEPPVEFDYRGRHFTPRSFFAEYLPEWKNSKALELNYSPGGTRRHLPIQAYDGARYAAYQTGDPYALLRIIEETLRAGETALLGYKVIDEDHTQQSGTIGFSIHGLNPPAAVNWNDPDIMDHSVLAIGAEWNPDGHIEKVLVKNSWGVTANENFGLHWMQADYLFLLNSVEIHPRLERKFKDEGLIE